MSEPFVRVERAGRWTYRLTVIDGINEYGPCMSGVCLGWTVLGRWRVKGKARRCLRDYAAHLARRADVWEER